MSSISKPLASSNYDISTEESGWTMYFEDFFNDHKCSTMSLSAVASSSSHFVSDATSLVEKKFASSEHVVQELSSLNEKGKRSSFKRRKNIRTALVDEALEDTATSPLNSSKEKGNISGQKDERKELSYNNNGRDSD